MTPSDLTPRQLEVCALVAGGMPTKRIAASLGISEQRVRCLMASVAIHLNLDKGLEDRVLIARWWWEREAQQEHDAA